MTIIEMPYEKHGAEDDWVIVSDEEGDEFFYNHGPADMTKEGLERQKWYVQLACTYDYSCHRVLTSYNRLAKQEHTLTGSFIVIELGPHRTFQTIPLEKVPQSSEVLVEVSKRQPGTRNIWLKNMDGAEFKMYIVHASRPRTMEDLAWQEDWLNILRLGVAAEMLRDSRIQATVAAALHEKSQLARYRRMAQLSTEDVQYGYAKTEPGSRLRQTLAELGFAEPEPDQASGALPEASHSQSTHTEAVKGGNTSVPASPSKKSRIPLPVSSPITIGKARDPPTLTTPNLQVQPQGAVFATGPRASPRHEPFSDVGTNNNSSGEGLQSRIPVRPWVRRGLASQSSSKETMWHPVRQPRNPAPVESLLTSPDRKYPACLNFDWGERVGDEVVFHGRCG
jgi:hypothetical protein